MNDKTPGNTSLSMPKNSRLSKELADMAIRVNSMQDKLNKLNDEQRKHVYNMCLILVQEVDELAVKSCQHMW